eukprot:jgi/Bigna1/87959/estExt_fgenesh1_pg.C_260094
MTTEVLKTYASIDKCFAFKLPPRTGAGQYSAKSWGEPVWEGMCKMVGKGGKGLILLENGNGGYFAKSPVAIDTTLEGVADSSRYFVLKVVGDGGRHAYVGIGFGDRAHAFDLKSGIQRFQSILKAETDAKSGKGDIIPDTDFSLGQGEQIKINLTKDKLKSPSEKKKKGSKKKKSSSKSKKAGDVPSDWVTF